MKTSVAVVVLLLAVGCDGFVGEVSVNAPQVTDPDYLVLRPVASMAGQGSATASLNRQTFFYEPASRIMDLRHFDPLTATVEEPFPGRYAVSIRTSPEGNRLLERWTAANLERQLGVFVDGKLISAPYIRSTISDMIVIEDDFTKSRAEAIVARVRRGGAAI